MPTLPIEISTVSAIDSAARVIAALTYYANPQNPDLTTAEFIRDFTPMKQSDAIVINRYLVLMSGGTIRVRNRAVLAEWAQLILG